MSRAPLSDADYRQLLELRTRLRGFLHWSEEQARRSGITPTQHQLLLAVRGHGNPRGPTIGELADYLCLRHQSTVGLVDRAEDGGLVRRTVDPDDGRIARVVLTGAGRNALRALTTLHLDELGRLARHLQPLLNGLDLLQADHGGSKVSS